MLGWRQLKRARDDTGAIAILTTIVLVGAVLPLTALGATAYVRTSTAEELTRAADAGSLAGAAEIPLVDLAFLSGYTSGQPSAPGGAYSSSADPVSVPGSLNNGPLADACTVALGNAENAHGLGASWANKGLSCTARYGPAPLLTELQSCSGELGAISGLPALLAVFNATVAPFAVVAPPLPTLLGALSDPTGTVLSGLGPLLPALFQPTVQTTLTWQVHSPFDGLMPGGGARAQTVSALAHEVAKNAVVLPDLTYAAYVENNSGAGLPAATGALFTSPGIDINPTVVQGRQLLDQTIKALAQSTLLTGAAPDCAAGLTAAQGVLDQLVDPPGNAQNTVTTSLDLANQQLASGQAVNVIGLSSLLNVPFLDFTQVQCSPGVQLTSVTQLTQTVQDLIGGLPPAVACSAGFIGAFRANLVAP